MWSSGERQSARLPIVFALTATCAGGFAIALLLAAPGSSQTPALTLPSLPLPTVTVPTLTVPTVTALTVTVPTETAPTTTAAGNGGGSTTPTVSTTRSSGGVGATTTGSAQQRCNLRGGHPDSGCTPGHSLRMTRRAACAHARRLPQPTAAVRLAVLGDYGIAAGDASLYRIDRLVADRIGGTNARRNLWPVPFQKWSGQKRWLDARLLRLVCSRRMTMTAAQKVVSRDWLAAYRRLHR